MVRRRALAMTLLTTFALAGCGVPVQEAATTSVDSESLSREDLFQSPKNLEEIISLVSAATFLIDCPDSTGSGTGFSYSRDGASYSFIVTNHHVVESCLRNNEPPQISDQWWNTIKGEVIVSQQRATNPDLDISESDFALIRIDKRIATLRRWSSSTPKGSWVMTSGYPDIDPDYYEHAVTIGSVVANSRLSGTIITAAINPGSSGGPVINSRGELIGIVYAGYDQSDLNDTGYFLGMDRFWEFINKNSGAIEN